MSAATDYIQLTHAASEIDGTIDEVYAARGTYGSLSAKIASKQDELSQSQLAAANSGITAEKLTADETAIGEVINGGAAGTKNDLMLQISEMKIYNGAAQGASWSENVCTVAGITFAVNADFTITVSGTLSGSAATFRLFRQRENIWGGEFLSGCPTGGGTSTYRMFVQRETSPMTDVASDTGAGSIVGTDTTSKVYAAIQVKTSIQSPVTFKPMICRKTLYDVNPDYEPYAPAKTNVEITPALVELVDNVAKNCATVNNATYTNVNRWFNIDSICDKNCVLSLDSITSTDTNASTCALLFKFEDDTLSSKIIQLPRGTRYEREFSLAKNVKGLHIYASDTYNHSGTTNTVTITNLMLCTKAAWDISHKFVPYALPNPTLTPAAIKAVDEGAKNIQPVDLEIIKQSTTAGSWSGNVYTESGSTYTINDDGTITVDTTGLTNQSNLFLSPYLDISNGAWVVSGCPQGGTSETYYIATNTTSWGNSREYGNGVELNINNNKIRLAISVKARSGILVFRPMVCTAADWAVSQKFIPYRPSWQEMWEMIQALQNGTRSAPALAKAEPEVEPETGEEEMR